MHLPAQTEVPIFLAARNQSEQAGERFATGIEILHNEVSKSMEGLVEVVNSLLNDRAEKLYQYEVDLKNDYVYNDKTRQEMNKKLEESARIAQGLFANLLMRVAQPEDNVGSGANSALGGMNNNNSSNDPNNNDEDMGEEEPDWNEIIQHEPARTEVPVFLTAREQSEAASSRFASAIEQFQTEVEGYARDLTQVVADVYNSRTMKLDEYEQILKDDYVANDKKRNDMQSNLEESASAAQNMFGELLRRVMQPNEQSVGHQGEQMGGVGMLTQATTLGESP